MNGNSVKIPIALIGIFVLLALAAAGGMVRISFQQGELKAEVANNGDRLARIERLLDAPTAVRNP